MRGKLILVLGGARSGKSNFAEQQALRLGKRVTYIATAAVKDGEMAERVQKHRARRPATWETVEEEKNVIDVIRKGQKGDVFILDCVTLWLTNLLLDQCPPFQDVPAPSENVPVSSKKEAWILEQAHLLGDSVSNGADLIMVSNETGLGLVPENPLARTFRDLAGKVNQILASKADEVYFIIAGLPLRIKPFTG
ncbi:MAG TPA: bifunctional adenosylcobinamide kinase/adenosylcobinamide-phosphate guanylyltransferase [Bacillota bacterium]|nr:bifunctional adenosylcobinamide kinase/adenosylcobinamide-phosphate guanylyltransferase [Peptococcaceae bacterium MAG4]HPU36257.1 bifunctional adenosylcobinamide kinase/adenosylcobinamide-phosphate guanylyltransferase [Bacillota bacterium]HPZ42427.1 bifunctional adenosylcobinamide kinase/adenosylcobinamide-phosphate guanylyltransferase [Bacillota bacterium]HQD75093.1 bifunctional adenosylcobinamide kinase/adenosylcobinamide-phosphate guanylyltransferase [Bacillota bacterium]HUM57650.1 bifunc